MFFVSILFAINKQMKLVELLIKLVFIVLSVVIYHHSSLFLGEVS